MEANGFDLVARRMLDVGVALAGLICLAPLAAVIALAIRVESRGPILFSQVRLGHRGCHFWLHKFRATFATRCLWAGVDLRTVQLWLGHSDIESTMRYLKPSRSQQVREKVNEIFG